MRVRTAAAALGMVMALTGCGGEGNGSSPTNETPTSVPSSTTSPMTTLSSPATTTSSAVPSDDTETSVTATTGTSTTAVVPAGYQWWDASPYGFAVAVPEAWVIHGALDDETLEQLGANPESIAFDIPPQLLATNPANEDEFLTIIADPAPRTGMYEEIVGISESDLRAFEDDFEAEFHGTTAAARVLQTAEGYPVIHVSASDVALGFTLHQCFIAVPGGPEFFMSGMMEAEQLDVVLGSFTVTQGTTE